MRPSSPALLPGGARTPEPLAACAAPGASSAPELGGEPPRGRAGSTLSATAERRPAAQRALRLGAGPAGLGGGGGRQGVLGWRGPDPAGAMCDRPAATASPLRLCGDDAASSVKVSPPPHFSTSGCSAGRASACTASYLLTRAAPGARNIWDHCEPVLLQAGRPGVAPWLPGRRSLTSPGPAAGSAGGGGAAAGVDELLPLDRWLCRGAPLGSDTPGRSSPAREAAPGHAAGAKDEVRARPDCSHVAPQQRSAPCHHAR